VWSRWPRLLKTCMLRITSLPDNDRVRWRFRSCGRSGGADAKRSSQICRQSLATIRLRGQEPKFMFAIPRPDPSLTPPPAFPPPYQGDAGIRVAEQGTWFDTCPGRAAHLEPWPLETIGFEHISGLIAEEANISSSRVLTSPRYRRVLPTRCAGGKPD